ncbi:MAG TPA: class I SAM-dependent methyltransferase [Acidimicrobiia bacterium]|jgi:SAM-dependent methyltransferase
MVDPAYDVIGRDYAARRRPDERVAAAIHRALGAARTLVNVGAGSGSYEPTDRAVVAVEPSSVMIDQRPRGAAPAVRGVAEAMPFAADTFDVALAVLTLHHWSDVPSGLRELQRVARRQVVLTWDPRVTIGFWLLTNYLPAIGEHEARLDPIDSALSLLDVERVEPVLVPADCTDGFLAAYWRRPEAYLDPRTRGAMSGIAVLDPRAVDEAMRRLAHDVHTGAWHERHADLLAMDEFDAGYRLVVSRSRR